MSPMKTLLLDIALAMVSYHVNRKVANTEGIKCVEQQDLYWGYSVYTLSPPSFFFLPVFSTFPSFSPLFFIFSYPGFCMIYGKLLLFPLPLIYQHIRLFPTSRTHNMTTMVLFHFLASSLDWLTWRLHDCKLLVYVVNGLTGFRGPNLAHI